MASPQPPENSSSGKDPSYPLLQLPNFKPANSEAKPRLTTDEVASTKNLNNHQKTQSSASSLKPMKAKSSTRWWQSWQFWGILLVIGSGGVGYGATSILLKLPRTQSCSTVFWPVASASMRLYCAQTLADENTVESLLGAISLVGELPDSHPIRKEIDRNVEKWANEILDIGETKFQEGNLKAAEAIAKQIPPEVSAYELVESKIASWQGIWSDAESKYAKVEDSLRKAQWSGAFSWAVQLTDSKNDYWATTKYSEIIDSINLAQEETLTLDKAETQLSAGGIDSLLEAINKAEAIPEDSYTYANAQKILTDGKSKLLATIDNLIAKEQWSQLQKTTYRIPSSLNLETEVEGWQVVANAGRSAALDTVLGLEDAIVEAEKLPEDNPLYPKAQELAERWNLEIDDVRHLSRANELARARNIEAYNAAIIEVSLISAGNPRYREAQQKISKWRSEIQIIEDRPIINRAKELAIPSTPEAWRRAIAEIRLVSANSPLYSEAQQNVRTWRANIERIEDRPILDRAIALGDRGDYSEAIEAAKPISQNRALSKEAQEYIALWRDEIQAERYLQDADYLARQNTAESLAKAIRTIRQIGRKTALYSEVVPNVNDWSRQIVDLAERASYRSLEQAIAIAKQVPSGTAAHPRAERLIEKWQNILNPTPKIQKQEKSNSNRELNLEKNKKRS